MRYLVVGDVHVKTSNLAHIGKLARFLCTQAARCDTVVLLGDVLDYHEKVLTPCLNAAYALVRELSAVRPVYVLVGNHDYISNSQFLTDAHWLNGMKPWPRVTVVDRVVVTPDAVFCPYVPPGRLADALATAPDYVPGKLLFCHQEFRGCDMGAVRSALGDCSADAALAVSGHIHDNQWVGSNIYYVGAPIQHAFGDADKRVVAFVDSNTLTVDEVPVGIGRKLTLTVSADALAAALPADLPDDTSVRLTVTGSVADCQAAKKTSHYKKLASRAKIVFRTTATTALPHTKPRTLFADSVRALLADNAAALAVFESLALACAKT